ncbi:MAG: hypothetical protein IJF76_01750 [Clostridia bacterium]|nr:hypothetical protein [Clostridia bacterium]
MSYKVNARVAPITGNKTGIVPDVYEECAVFAEGRLVTLSRGKLVISGYEIEVDGREVINVPYDWKSGESYIIGSLAVKGGFANSFRISLRENLTLTTDDVLSLGEGVYEVLLAKVFVGEEVSVKSCMDLLLDGDSLDSGVPVRGESIALTDAKRGFLKNVRLCGRSKGDGIDTISHVPSRFRIKAYSKNLFDYKNCPIALFEEDKKSSYVCADQVSGYVDKFDEGYNVRAWKMGGVNPELEGFLEIGLGRVSKGAYAFSYDVTVLESWYGNEENNVLCVVYANGEKITNKQVSGTLNQNTRDTFSFSLSEESEVVVKFYLSGLYVHIGRIQFETGEDATEYTPCFDFSTEIVIRDLKGAEHELRSTSSAHDEIVKYNGKYVLLRHTALAYEHAIGLAKPFSNYIYNTSSSVNYLDNISDVLVMPGEYALYEPKKFEVVELDQSGLVGLERIALREGLLTIEADCELKPEIVGEYLPL